jgi:L-asparaginase
LRGEDLLAASPKVNEIASVDLVQPCNVPSFSLAPNQVLDFVWQTKKKLVDQDYAGAVILQGTATIEETAYLADLVWDCPKPLVFTGAMLNFSEPDCDGPRNIYDAILTAISPKACCNGVLVTIAGEIHAARDVVKQHKCALAAFASLNTGPIGLNANGRGIVFYRTPLLRRCYNITRVDAVVDIIKIALGSDSRLIQYSVASGAQAIVLECFPGGGGVTPTVMASVQALRAKGIIFVMVPRSPLGSSVAKAGGGCGPVDLRQCGVIVAGDLSAIKARLLLMVLLAAGFDEQAIRQEFEEVAP